MELNTLLGLFPCPPFRTAEMQRLIIFYGQIPQKTSLTRLGGVRTCTARHERESGNGINTGSPNGQFHFLTDSAIFPNRLSNHVKMSGSRTVCGQDYVPGYVSGCIPNCVTGYVSDRVSGCVSKCVTGYVPSCVSGCVTGCVPSCVTGYVPSCVSDCVPSCVTGCVSDCVPGCVSGCVPSCATGCVTARVAPNVFDAKPMCGLRGFRASGSWQGKKEIPQTAPFERDSN